MKKLDSSRKLGTMPIGKLLFSMSVPAMLSMLVQSLYNIIDSVFVAKLGEAALAAVSFAFPMQMLVLSIALGIGIGTSSLIARKLGQNDNYGASMSCQTGLFCSLVASVVFLAIGYFISDLFIKMFTKDTVIIGLSLDYLSIVTMFSAGMFIEILFSKSLQSTGNMIMPMISQLIGAVVNIILDPIFIFTLKLGVKGAAIATVIGQFCAMTFIIISIIVRKPCIKMFFYKFRFKKEYFVNILKVGLPTTIMNAVGSLTVTILNLILVAFSNTAVVIFGIYFKLQSFVFMPTFGLNQGAMPILGYNYGANNRKRFDKTFRTANITAFIIMLFGFILFMTIPETLLKMFSATDDMMKIGVPALRIMSLAFLPASFSIVCTSMFQAVGHGVKSMLMSLLRQVILLIPTAAILSKIVGLNGAWWAYPIAEIVTLIIFAPISLLTIKKVFAQLNQKMDLAQIKTFAEELATADTSILETLSVQTLAVPTAVEVDPVQNKSTDNSDNI